MIYYVFYGNNLKKWKIVLKGFPRVNKEGGNIKKQFKQFKKLIYIYIYM